MLDADPENAEAWLGLYYAANSVKDAAGILRTADRELAETGATLQECDSGVSANEQYVGGLLGGKYFSNAEKYASANTREEIQNLRASVSGAFEQEKRRPRRAESRNRRRTPYSGRVQASARRREKTSGGGRTPPQSGNEKTSDRGKTPTGRGTSGAGKTP